MEWRRGMWYDRADDRITKSVPLKLLRSLLPLGLIKAIGSRTYRRSSQNEKTQDITLSRV